MLFRCASAHVTERPCSKKLRMAVLARLSVGAFWKSSMACRTDCNTSRALVIHCRAGTAVPDTLTCSLLVCRHLKDPKAFRFSNDGTASLLPPAGPQAQGWTGKRKSSQCECWAGVELHPLAIGQDRPSRLGPAGEGRSDGGVLHLHPRGQARYPEGGRRREDEPPGRGGAFALVPRRRRAPGRRALIETVACIGFSTTYPSAYEACPGGQRRQHCFYAVHRKLCCGAGCCSYIACVALPIPARPVQSRYGGRRSAPANRSCKGRRSIMVHGACRYTCAGS